MRALVILKGSSLVISEYGIRPLAVYFVRLRLFDVHNRGLWISGTDAHMK